MTGEIGEGILNGSEINWNFSYSDPVKNRNCSILMELVPFLWNGCSILSIWYKGYLGAVHPNPGSHK